VLFLKTMFVLVELRDTVTIAPRDFHRKMQHAVTHALNKKFANKVGNAYYILINTQLLVGGLVIVVRVSDLYQQVVSSTPGHAVLGLYLDG